MFYSISFYANRPTFLTDYEGVCELFGEVGRRACDEIDSGFRAAFIGEVEIQAAEPDNDPDLDQLRRQS